MINVMLMDEDFLFQKAFAKMIEDLGDCRLVGVAENGAQAMELVNHYHPRLIFSDVALGEESGISLCRAIKEMFPQTRVYILSNYCNLRLMQSSMKAGVEEYLLRPLPRKKLASLFLSEQKKTQKSDDADFEELFAAVGGRDYRQAVRRADQVTRILFEEKDLKKRKEMLETLASNLFYTIPGMDQSQKNYYLQKYELRSMTLCRQTLCSNWLVQIITEVFRQICALKYVHMNQVCQYIENNKNYEITLTELAQQAGISGGYLSRIFKKYYNISVVDYIHMRKIHMAKYYMCANEMNISDIAFMLGYSEAGYFCKIFKKYEGMTPSAFQNQCAGQISEMSMG